MVILSAYYICCLLEELFHTNLGIVKLNTSSIFLIQHGESSMVFAMSLATFIQHISVGCNVPANRKWFDMPLSTGKYLCSKGVNLFNGVGRCKLLQWIIISSTIEASLSQPKFFFFTHIQGCMLRCMHTKMLNWTPFVSNLSWSIWRLLLISMSSKPWFGVGTIEILNPFTLQPSY